MSNSDNGENETSIGDWIVPALGLGVLAFAIYIIIVMMSDDDDDDDDESAAADSGTDGGTGGRRPAGGRCTETATTSVPADKALCDSVTGDDLLTRNMCESKLTTSTADAAATKACTYTTNAGRCTETATTSVPADKTLCDSVIGADLLTPDMCESKLTTSTADAATTKACTYTSAAAARTAAALQRLSPPCDVAAEIAAGLPKPRCADATEILDRSSTVHERCLENADCPSVHNRCELRVGGSPGCYSQYTCTKPSPRGAGTAGASANSSGDPWPNDRCN
tara:strand:- start:1740 stop:2582 length:843 start_codon:yes stop_codon:yes gene_type:complete